MHLLDTCTLLWLTHDPQKLSRLALKAIEKMQRSGGYISSVSFWEIATKIRNGKLSLGLSAAEYLGRVKEAKFLQIMSVDENIWIKSGGLEWNHRDPVDRALVASAMSSNLNIITPDPRITEFYDRVVW